MTHDIEVTISSNTHAFLLAETDAGLNWLRNRAKPVTHFAPRMSMVHLSFLDENLSQARCEGLLVSGDFEAEKIA